VTSSFVSYSRERPAGLHKKYQLSCVDEEHLAANVERDDYPACITADAFQLHKVLASFQSTLDEITLVTRPEDKVQSHLHAIQMVSYVSASKGDLLIGCLSMLDLSLPSCPAPRAART
jgi:hypothetical protein